MDHQESTSSDMKSLAEIMRSQRRFEMLGGRTLAENAEHWRQRHAAGTGVVWPNGPGGAGRDLPPADELDLPLHLARCGVPDRAAGILVAGADVDPDFRGTVLAVREWMERGGSFLLLHGVSGGGKSVAAATVFLAARETLGWTENGGRRGVTRYDSTACAFMPVTDLSRESYFDNDARDLISLLKKRRLLVLDDMGAEMMSAGYLATLDDIIRVRAEDPRARTVLTSNVSAKRDPKAPEKVSLFEERYGARIARRIRDSGAVVACEGKSMRGAR